MGFLSKFVKIVKIYQNLSKIVKKIISKDVAQAFKNSTWALIMMPENDRPITGVKTEIS